MCGCEGSGRCEECCCDPLPVVVEEVDDDDDDEVTEADGDITDGLPDGEVRCACK